MTMTLTQHQLDRAELVLVVDKDGLYEWSSNRSNEEVAAYLERVAHAIRAEQS